MKTSQNSRIKFIIVVCAFCSLIQGCISYDKAVLYKKGYSPGHHAELKYNGFYRNFDKSKNLTPIFFYTDGSVIFCGYAKNTFDLQDQLSQNQKIIWGYWGNYKISGDTIIAEIFSANISLLREVRSLKKGVIEKGKIRFYEHVDRENNVSKIDEVWEFVEFSIKPDSTANWIRQKRKYNK